MRSDSDFLNISRNEASLNGLIIRIISSLSFTTNHTLLILSHLPLSVASLTPQYYSNFKNPVLLFFLLPCNSLPPSPTLALATILLQNSAPFCLSHCNNRTVSIPSKSIVYFNWKNMQRTKKMLFEHLNMAPDTRSWVQSAFLHYSTTLHLILDEILF